MPEQNQIQIQFSISDIQTLEFALTNTPEISAVEKMKFPFKIDAGYFFETDKKNVVIDVKIDISLNDSPESVVCHLLCRFKYFINNFDEAFTVKDGQITYPAQFLTTLLSISLSTARGILVTKTESTNLRGIYMPVVDPSKLQLFPNPPPHK